MTNQQELLTGRLDRLESRAAMRDLVSDYCHGFDKRDWTRFIAIWADDCIWDIGPPFGVFEGLDGIRTAIYEVLWPAWERSLHLTTNLRIEFTNDNRATGLCDVSCTGTLADGSTQIVGATYTDVFCRREARWQIQTRKVTMHYFNPLPGVTLSAPGDH